MDKTLFRPGDSKTLSVDRPCILRSYFVYNCVFSFFSATLTLLNSQSQSISAFSAQRTLCELRLYCCNKTVNIIHCCDCVIIVCCPVGLSLRTGAGSRSSSICRSKYGEMLKNSLLQKTTKTVLK